MGTRKHISAEARKAEKNEISMARLGNVPTSPRKMRLVAELVRGMEVEKGLMVLKTTRKEAAQRLYGLLKSGANTCERDTLHDGIKKTFNDQLLSLFLWNASA